MVARAGRRLASALCALASLCAPAAHAQAQAPAQAPAPAPAPAQAPAPAWRIFPAVGLESLLTDNVNLLPADQRKSDWVNQITPALTFSGSSAHTKLAGAVSVPIILYTRTSGRNYVAPEASIDGTLEAIDKFLFVDTSVRVSQQYLDPFGAQPNELTSVTQNRYTAQAYTVSPYIKGKAPGDVDYELRQSDIWSNATGISTGTGSNRSYTDGVSARVSQAPRPGGWKVDYARSDIHFTGQGTLSGQDRETTEIGHVNVDYQPDPTLLTSLIGGYEENHFFTVRESGAVYGASAEWRPTDRMTVKARGEHRFFGAGYSLSFDNHTPHTMLSLLASRDISSYPQQLASLTGGGDVRAMLDSLLASQVPDPAQRQALVDQTIRDRGLPLTLSGPLALYAQQVTLVESESASFGILGARNSIFLRAYRSRSQPVAGSVTDSLSTLLQRLIDNTQVGTTVTWTHQLAPSLRLGIDGGWLRTTANSGAGGATRLYTLGTTLSTPLSALTTLSGGLRYQDSTSNITTSYREFAVFVGLDHRFR